MYVQQYGTQHDGKATFCPPFTTRTALPMFRPPPVTPLPAILLPRSLKDATRPATQRQDESKFPPNGNHPKAGPPPIRRRQRILPVHRPAPRPASATRSGLRPSPIPTQGQPAGMPLGYPHPHGPLILQGGHRLLRTKKGSLPFQAGCRYDTPQGVSFSDGR